MKFLVCSKCGSSFIRRSKRHGVLEWIVKRIFIVPRAMHFVPETVPSILTLATSINKQGVLSNG
jgi:hypothetical protein